MGRHARAVQAMVRIHLLIDASVRVTIAACDAPVIDILSQ